MKLRDTSNPSHMAAAAAGVLVVDDSAAIREMLPMELRSLNVEVTTAASGADALRLCREGLRPAVAILDHHLPDMTGLELCRHLRARASLSSTYVVMLTGDESLGRIASLHDGADDYLSKPYDANNLRATIRAGLRAQAFARAQVRRARRDAIMWLAMVAAHEINNPLAAAISNLDYLLGRVGAGAGGDENLETVRDSIAALQRIRDATGRMRIDSAAPRPTVVACDTAHIARQLGKVLAEAGVVVTLSGDIDGITVAKVDLDLVILATLSIVQAAQPHCTGPATVSIWLEGPRLTLLLELAGAADGPPDSILEPALVDDGVTPPHFEPRLTWLETRLVTVDGQILTSRVDDKWRFSISVPVEPASP